MRRCTLCGVTAEGAELPALLFTALDGQPCICERCVARALGVERPWGAVIEDRIVRPN